MRTYLTDKTLGIEHNSFPGTAIDRLEETDDGTWSLTLVDGREYKLRPEYYGDHIDGSTEVILERAEKEGSFPAH